MTDDQRIGRRSKLTPERRRAIVNAVAAGVPVKYACLQAAVHETTVYRWIQRGRTDKRGIYVDFARAMDRANAESIAALVSQVSEAAQKDWRAATWLLTRRAPDHFMDPGKRAELAAAEARAEVARVEADQRVHYIATRRRRLGVVDEWESEQE
jgi:hypothetical protein